MIKNLKVSAIIQKKIITAAAIIFTLHFFANIIYGFDTIFNKRGLFTDNFLVEIVVPVLLPLVLFGIGYIFLKSKSNQTRLFNSVLYVTSCYLLATISQCVYKMLHFNIDSFNWVQCMVVVVIVQVVSILLVKSQFRQTKGSFVPRIFQIYFIIMTLMTICIDVHLASHGPDYCIWFWAGAEVVPTLLSILYIGLGYFALSNIKSKLSRLFLACVGTALAVITYHASIPVSNIFQNPESTTLYVTLVGCVIAAVVYAFSIKAFRRI